MGKRWILCMLLFIETAQTRHCPNHWVYRPNGDSCYRFWPTVLRSWQESRDACVLSGGDLLTLDSADEKEWIITQVSNFPVDNEWWIGLKRSDFNESTWLWNNGTERKYMYIQWGSGEPNNYKNEEDCAEIWDNLLNDKNCQQSLQSICERPKDTPLLCDVDRGWDGIFPDSCYKYFDENQTKEQAMESCQDNFASLLTLTTAVEHKTLSHILQERSNSASWLDLRVVQDRNFSRGYRIAWESELDPVKLFSGSVPSMPTDCAQLDSSIKGLANLKKTDCGNRAPFFCKKPQGTCDVEGSIQYQGTCVVVSSASLIWNEARGYCNLRGMQLIEIASKYFLDFFVNELRKDVTDSEKDQHSFWLALSSSVSEMGAFTWDSKTSIGLFEKDKIKDLNGPGCGYMNYGSDNWNISDCGIQRDVICTIPAGKPTRSPSNLKPRYTCPDMYKLLNSKCVRKYSGMPSNWYTARTICQQNGNDLFTVHSSSDLDYISEQITADTWIGLNDRRTEGEFVWLDTTLKAKPTNWLKNQPDNIEIGGRYSENCVAAQNRPGNTSHGKWLDIPCSMKLDFICESIAELNIALGKIAESSGDNPERGIDNCFGRNPSYTDCCSLTRASEKGSWWQLDLGTVYPIGKLMFHKILPELCDDCPDKYKGYRITVSNSSEPDVNATVVYRQSGNDEMYMAIDVITLDNIIPARYVRIDNPDQNKQMFVCELEVYPALKHRSKMEPHNSSCVQNSTKWRGNISHTLSGKLCNVWSSQQTYGNDSFPDGTKDLAKNYCRDPSGSGWLWCYVSDQKEFCPMEFCDVTWKTDSQERNECGTGWMYNEITDTCYKLVEQPLSWGDARSVCQSLGVDLAQPKIEEHRVFLEKILQTTSLNAFWVGVYGTAGPKRWSFLSGTGTFKPSEETSEKGYEFCIHYAKDRGFVVDRCLQRKPFLCQAKELSLTTNGDGKFMIINELKDGKRPMYKGTSFIFQFKGLGAANILLQSALSDMRNNVCLITLCGLMNTKSTISNPLTSKPLAVNKIPNLCSDTEFKLFWISWDDAIKVGHGPDIGKNVIMSWSEPKTLNFHYISISTGEGNSGFWKIEEKLDTDEMVNLAVKKSAKSSSVFDTSGPDKAVDDCKNNNYFQGCCFHSNDENEPWWEVDLGEAYPIKEVIITRRWDCEHCKRRLRGFRVSISLFSHTTSIDDIAYVAKLLPSDPVISVPTPGRKGRFVKIDIPGRSEALELCEVQVVLDTDASICGGQWEAHDKNCFLFITRTLNWNDARSYCTALGGDLAVIKTPEEQLFILEQGLTRRLQQTEFNYGFWLGYHDTSIEGDFKAVDGQPIFFTSWGDGEPNDYASGEDCVALRIQSSSKTSGSWNDYSCNRPLGQICKKNDNPMPGTTTQMTTPPTSVPIVHEGDNVCGAGWTRTDGGGCYKAIIKDTAFINYWDAYKECLKVGARLAEISDQAEATFITEYLRRIINSKTRHLSDLDQIWIAGADFKEGNWQWLLYDKPWVNLITWREVIHHSTIPHRYFHGDHLHYDHYFDDQQDDGGAADCAVIHITDLKLNDVPCSENVAVGYLCEKQYTNKVCEEGWFHDVRTDNCYKLESKLSTWKDARALCVSKYKAHLVKTLSKRNSEFLGVILHSTTTQRYWYGETIYQFDNNDVCGTMRPEENLIHTEDSKCDSTRQFVCQKLAGPKPTQMVVKTVSTSVTTLKSTVGLSPTSLPATEHTGCEDGWKQKDGGGCYMAIIKEYAYISYWDAYKECLKVGARLAEMSDLDDATFIIEYLNGVVDNQFKDKHWGSWDAVWIAGADFSETDWKWLLYDRLWSNQITKLWIPGQPDNYDTGEDCATVPFRYLKESTFLNDCPCSITRHGYICEKEDTPLFCEDGWMHDTRTDKCYKLESNISVFDLAITKCLIEYNAVLLEKPSEKDSDFLGVILHSTTRQRYWYEDVHPKRQCKSIIADEIEIQTQLESCSVELPFVCQKQASRKSIPKIDTTLSTSTTELPTEAENTWVKVNEMYSFMVIGLEMVTWNEARMYCNGYGGHLLSVVTLSELSFVLDVLHSRTFPNDLWIGLNSIESATGWHWTDGSPLALFYWFDGSRWRSNKDKNCVALLTNSDESYGRWKEANCTEKRGYICKRRDISATTEIPAKDKGKLYGGCDQGWRAFRNNCYLIVEEQANWDESRILCQGYDSQLASIQDPFEQAFVYSHLPHESYCFNIHNNDTECAKWAEWGECDNNPTWMARNCHKACQMCLHNCDDRYESATKCMEWANIDECDTNPAWMLYNCAQACGVCQGAPTRGFWIGLEKPREQYTYSWINGDEVRYTNWDTTQPLMTTALRTCAGMYTQIGTWNDGLCEDFLSGFVCKKASQSGVVPTSSSDRYCEGTDSLFFRGNCYTLVMEKKTWQEARQYCSEKFDSLVSVTNRYIDAFISSYSVTAWLGLATRDSGFSSWTWLDGQKVDYFNSFASTEGEGCYMLEKDSWIVQPCDTTQNFICQEAKVTMSTPEPTGTSAPTNSCAPGWIFHESMCYYISSEDERTSRNHAQSRCSWYGASLATLKDKNEQQFITALVALTNNDISTWIDSAPMFYNGSEIAKNVPGVSGCIAIQNQDITPEPCFNELRYICEIPAGITPVHVDILASTPVCNGSSERYTWYLHDGHCYHIGNTTTSATTADIVCRLQGASLASIHSKEEIAFLQRLVYREAWIGLELDVVSSKWEWTDGTKFDFVREIKNNVNDSFSDEQCAFLTRGGIFKQKGCEEDFYRICKKPLIDMNETVSQVFNETDGCPPDFILFQNKCYFISKIRVDWFEADLKCRKMHSRLATIISDQEQEFIDAVTMMNARETGGPKVGHWLGLKNGKWVDGTNQQYDNWVLLDLQMSVRLVDYCGFNLQTEWHGADCRTLRPFVCSRYKSPKFTRTDADCPEGFDLIENFCYKITPSQQSWNESLNICGKQSSKLLEIYDDSYSKISDILQLFVGKAFWVGGTFSPIKGLTWNDGRKFNTTIEWSSSMTTGSCVYLDPKKGLRAKDCSTALPAVCFVWSGRSSDVTTGTTSSETTSELAFECRQDAWLYHNYCYVVETRERLNFRNADIACRKLRMTLTSINSVEENRALVKYIDGNTEMLHEYYIGIQRHKNKSIVWLDGSRMTYDNYYKSWDTFSSRCSALSTADTMWYPKTCKERLGYICKGVPDRLVPVYTTRQRKSQDTTPSRRIPIRSRGAHRVEEKKDSVLTAGQIAGTVIGCLAAIFILAIIIHVARPFVVKKVMYPVDGQSLGFDNALFQRNSDTVSIN